VHVDAYDERRLASCCVFWTAPAAAWEQAAWRLASTRGSDAGALREVIRRFFIADESRGAIGEKLGLRPGSAASRISRGLVMLPGALEGEAQPAAAGDIDA
jgi:hypothetical protein